MQWSNSLLVVYTAMFYSAESWIRSKIIVFFIYLEFITEAVWLHFFYISQLSFQKFWSYYYNATLKVFSRYLFLHDHIVFALHAHQLQFKLFFWFSMRIFWRMEKCCRWVKTISYSPNFLVAFYFQNLICSSWTSFLSYVQSPFNAERKARVENRGFNSKFNFDIQHGNELPRTATLDWVKCTNHWNIVIIDSSVMIQRLYSSVNYVSIDKPIQVI